MTIFYKNPLHNIFLLLELKEEFHYVFSLEENTFLKLKRFFYTLGLHDIVTYPCSKILS